MPGAVAIFVPYPYAVSDHQARNAEYLSNAGAAFCIRQEAFVGGDWLALLAGVAKDRSRLMDMATAARSMAKPDATERVADICEELAGA